MSDRDLLKDDDSLDVQAFKALTKTHKVLRAEKKVLEAQVDTLEDYATTLTADKVDHSKLAAFLPVYEERRRKVYEQLQAIDDKLRETDQAMKKKTEALKTDGASKKRAAKVTVVVYADEEGPAQLSLQYGK